MKAGIGKAIINPEIGNELSGYGIYLGRKCTGIKCDLYSKALVFQEEGKRVVIISSDILGIDSRFTKRVRAKIRENTEIEPTNVLVSATHTHAGPAVFFLRGCGEVNPGYVEKLENMMVDAVKSALDNLADCEMWFGRTDLKGFAINRAVKDGPTDEELSVVALNDGVENVLHSPKTSTDVKKPFCVLSNFSCHCVVNSNRNTLATRDYVGPAEMILKEKLPETELIFLQGSCGDVNPVACFSEDIESAGKVFAGGLLEAVGKTNPISATGLKAVSRVIKLPVIVPTPEWIEKEYERFGETIKGHVTWERLLSEWKQVMYGRIENNSLDYIPAEIQVLKIGDLVISANPSELFVKFGMEIKRKSKYPYTMVTGYSNDFIGYIPDKDDFDRYGYASFVVPKLTDSFIFREDAGEILVRETLALINRLI